MGQKESRGYVHEDLVKFIPFTSMCPDDLHLRIRISTKLFNQVNMYFLSYCIQVNAEYFNYSN